MSGKFDGFSEDDINKMTTTTSRSLKTKKIGTHNVRGGLRRMPDTANVKDSSSVSHKIVDTVASSKPSSELTNLSVTSQEESIHFHPISTKCKNGDNKNEEEVSDESILHIEKSNGDSESKEVKENCCKSSSLSSTLPASSPFRGLSLKDFEAQRKLVEEQNRQKKEMLYKAIELHSQKTAAEVKKIEQIKAELVKLDSDLAIDVAILRKQIEAACIHYANIQKQYDRIESQFLKSKLDLHNASERKELLTEHLCTVIAHNEERKAKKLSELMEKVGISPTSSNSLDNINKE